jgi:DNA-binding protein YbaB
MLDDLARLRDEARDLAWRAEAARGSPARFSGRDPAGAATVTVDHDGRPCDVSVDRGWRQRVGVAGLSAAVRRAARAAAMTRLRAWTEALAAPGGGPAPSGADPAGEVARQLSEAMTGATTTGTSMTGTSMGAAGGRAALSELRSMLEAIDESLDDLSAQLRQHAGRAPTGRSAQGHVTVRLDSAGAVDAVEFDRGWLRDAAESSIASELREAFEAAWRRAAEHSPQRLIARSRLRALQDLASDPTLLVKRLGLRG